ncbi:MAG: Asp-tRNA(Asn)/Glu-tRNA(Gln) amidotransferase subunit GatC [Candidatus Uhrbacteria bacterium]|nr:Asp-tRNA(Asn)/Glu-tRNA(Gln) amidotransferase subunit GatC [Candidatus Uhrbacteria bacterium]
MFTTEDVKKIAKLSRLYISEAETEQYREQLGSILEYVDQLQAIDTTGVAELQHAVAVENVFRADEPSCNPEERRRAIEMFSAKKGDLLEVQAVFSKDV